MAGRLLLACYVKTKLQVDSKMAKAVYLQMSFDGWSRTQGTHHLLGYTAGSFGMTCFLDFIATKENHCTAKYMMEQFEAIVKKHGLGDKISGLITDNPSPMRRCWDLLGVKYPKLQCCGCWAHVLDLALKDLAKQQNVGDVSTDLRSEMLLFFLLFADINI